MSTALLTLTWALPLLLALFAGHRQSGWWTLAAPLPALLAAVLLPTGAGVSLPWLLLGVELGLDATGRIFLLFSALLWLAAAVYGAAGPAGAHGSTRYRLFFLLAMAGNLGLIVAGDMLSFYLGFTLMGLAAYGLIAHRASQRARRAANRYLAWTLAGEMLLFVAIARLALQQDGALSFAALQSAAPAGFTVLLLILGFGIKLALPGLHLWLPRAYAAAPAPVVAVLSGAMIKAGLLGWLRFLPPGDAALAAWGQALLAVGAAGIGFGTLAGLLQRRPRLLLGYSSIAKMGVLTAGMGAALAWPAAAPAVTAALAVYAAHHALVKGALFLGLGLAEDGGLRPWLLAGLAFLALALAGAPLSSGALAKTTLTAALPVEARHLLPLLAASAFASTLLMGRFMVLLWRHHGAPGTVPPAVASVAWLALLAVIAVYPFVLAQPGRLMANALPVALGLLLVALATIATSRWDVTWRTPGRNVRLTRLASRCRHALRRQAGSLRHGSGNLALAVSGWRAATARALAAYRRRPPPEAAANRAWPLAGGLWLGIIVTLLAALTRTD